MRRRQVSNANINALIPTLIFMLAAHGANTLQSIEGMKYPAYIFFVAASAFASWGLFKAAREGTTRFQKRAFKACGWAYLSIALAMGLGVSYLMIS